MIGKIDNINNILLAVLSQNSLPVGLARGRMGICIYFFESGRLRDNEKHTEIAEEILHGILSNINGTLPAGFEDGLAGIGTGIKFLIRNGYVNGDVNEILSDIDNEIIKKVSYPEFFERTNPFELIGLLYYFSSRIPDLNREKGETLYIYKEITIDIINRIYPMVADSMCREPLSFTVNYSLPLFLYVINQILSLNFYNYRIIKILEEMTPRMLSILPYVHANRLFLLGGMAAVNGQFRSGKWDAHIDLLKSGIDMDKIIWEELRNQNVYFENGATGILTILSLSEVMRYDSRVFLEKLKKSDVWDMLEKDISYFWQHMGLMRGFCGIALTYLRLSEQR